MKDNDKTKVKMDQLENVTGGTSDNETTPFETGTLDVGTEDKKIDPLKGGTFGVRV